MDFLKAFDIFIEEDTLNTIAADRLLNIIVISINLVINIVKMGIILYVRFGDFFSKS